VNGALGVGTSTPTTTGLIRATNDVVAYYSDIRLKENIELIDNAVDKVLKLRGVTYNNNGLAKAFGFNEEGRFVGVLAQDVKEVLPEAIRIAPFDADGDGKSVSGNDYMTVQYEKMVALLIEAIKEQQSQINELNEKLKRLE
jgi:hypothetical protein